MKNTKNIRKGLLKEISSQIPFDESLLDVVVLDATRAVDGKITDYINKQKKYDSILVNSLEKEEIRKSLLGYPNVSSLISNDDFEITTEEVKNAYSLISEGLERNPEVVISSLVGRIKDYLNPSSSEDYKKYLKELEKGEEQLIVFDTSNIPIDDVLETVTQQYGSLSNYHHIILLFHGDWEKIAKTAVFLEQFKVEKEFSVFNKNNVERRNETVEFVKKMPLKDSSKTVKLIDEYYSGVPYGFQFKDLFIASDSDLQVLVMQKIELDDSPKKCPSCLVESSRGNSYPRLLFKSFECSNPDCKDRSKIGRGKRFDLLSAKRQVMLENDSNFIPDDVVERYRRDVFISSNTLVADLVRIYSWDEDSVMFVNLPTEEVGNRRVLTGEVKHGSGNKVEELSLFKILKSIDNSLDIPKNTYKNKTIVGGSTLFEGNSTYTVHNAGAVDAAITSPPYYNAREYSTWVNFNSHLFDMVASAKAVYKVLKNGGVYIYNVGDIVGLDYNHVKSNMSRRRLMLGFYSLLILEIVGFTPLGNIIWDKGEVQSKRGSTPNKTPGYVNPINCYEHCLVMSKGEGNSTVATTVEEIDTVKKINSKGVNTFGHTAPYPLGIARLILPYVDEEGVVLDPFLGSGTTSIAMNLEQIDSVGFELDPDYYRSAVERVQEELGLFF